MAAPKNDMWLATWLDIVEDSGLPLILFVNGMVVMGEAVSQASYFREFGKPFVELAEKGGEDAEPLRQYFALLAEDAEKSKTDTIAQQRKVGAEMPPLNDRTPEQDEIFERLVRNFVYLKNAVAIIGSGGRVTLPFWRGRLSEVAGWSVGTEGVGGEPVYPSPARP